MLLHYSERGEGKPLLLLHGLFGSGDNLASVARDLAADHCVISLDLRNHGRSPHAKLIDYASMAADVAETLQHIGLSACAMMGHSMGGKTAMQIALSYPELVTRLCVSDIAPVRYSHHHSCIIAGLQAVQATQIASRSAADSVLAEYVEEPSVRGFLLKSLARSDKGNYRWRFNVGAIVDCYENIAAAPVGESWPGPTLFIGGSNSDYIRPEHGEAIKEHFPAASYRQIQGAGHWLHAEKPVAFNRLVRNFIAA